MIKAFPFFRSLRLRQLLTAGLIVVPLVRCVGADKQFRPSLENYLKRLGYESVLLSRDEQNHLTIRGKLDGKGRRFVLDTGWSITTVDIGVARKLKKLGEAGGTLDDAF